MRIFTSLVLAVCLVFATVSFTVACDDSLYDCPVYGPTYGLTYPSTPDTHWIPGNDTGIVTIAVPASDVLTK